MKISIFNHAAAANQTSKIDNEVSLSSPEDLSKAICSNAWAPGLFRPEGAGKKPSRKNSCLREMHLLVLDIDQGCTLEEAKTAFSGYRRIIATTRHHQLEKVSAAGSVQPAQDRFRVILFLEKSIATDEAFKMAWGQAHTLWPFIDPACKDSARFFYPCISVIEIGDGALFPTAPPMPDAASGAQKTRSLGALSQKTRSFLADGAKDGQWHDALVQATFDIKEQGYLEDEAKGLLVSASTCVPKTLDAHDLKVIRDIYRNRRTRHPARKLGSNVVYVRQTKEQKNSNLRRDADLIENMRKDFVPMMGNAFSGQPRLYRGLGVIAGHGGCKSTTAANVAHHFIQRSNKHVLYISNELTGAEVLAKIACADLDIQWSGYFDGSLSGPDKSRLAKRMEKLTEQVEVVTDDDTSGLDMSTLEGVKAVLETAARDQDVGFVVIDYLQTIRRSVEHPEWKQWEVSKELGTFLKEYGKRIGVPVLMLAQMRAPSHQFKTMAERVEWDKEFYHHAGLAIEIERKIEDGRTDLKVWKDRWGKTTGKIFPCRFNGARLLPWRTSYQKRGSGDDT